MAMVSLLMRGNFYGLITERDGLEYPTSILPLHPDDVRIDRDPDTFEKRVWVNGNRRSRPGPVPHPRLPPPRRRRGPVADRHGAALPRPVASRRRSSAASGSATAPRRRRCWRPTRPWTTTQAKTLQRSWIASHGGRRRPAVLSGGVKWKPITISPEESQFLQTRQHQQLEACQMLRIPPHMLSIVDKSTSWGTGIEQQSIGFVTYTLKPWLDRIEGVPEPGRPRGPVHQVQRRRPAPRRPEVPQRGVPHRHRGRVAQPGRGPRPGGPAADPGRCRRQVPPAAQLRPARRRTRTGGPHPIEETDDDDTAA